MEAWLPSAKRSFTPVRVTVWAVFQLLGVKVRVVGATNASSALSPLTDSTTSLLGWALSATVKLSVVPDSDTVAVVLDRVNPAVSSLVMVPVAVAVVRVAPLVGSARVTVKVSFASRVLSPCTLTVIVLLVSPAAKLTVPLGRVLPPKSAASTLPVTAQLTELAPMVSPERVTVKVKSLVPLLPSAWVASVAATAKVGRL